MPLQDQDEKGSRQVSSVSHWHFHIRGTAALIGAPEDLGPVRSGLTALHIMCLMALAWNVRVGKVSKGVLKVTWLRSTIGSLAAVTTALIFGLVTAGAAAAATSQATTEEAGYSFAGGGAHFRYAAASVYLRDASQYSSSIGGLGQSVQLWGGGRVYVLGVSDTTTNSPWSPAVAVFNNSTHALVDSASFGSVSYPTGHTVHESIYYNTATGDLSFTVQDITSSMAYTTNTVTMNVGTGVNFTQARIGTEFGDTPWSVPAFNPPASQQKTAHIFDGALTNYLGHRYGLAGYWANTSLIMTGPGSVTEAAPDAIVSNAFSTYLMP